MNYIIKRDGRKVLFVKNKIVMAIMLAFQAVDGKVPEGDEALIANNIADSIEKISNTKELTVEEIQDLVEKGLMESDRKDVAKEYILYREERTRVRKTNSKLVKKFAEHLMAKNVQNQNANMDEASFGGRKGEAANAVLKDYALDNCMSSWIKEKHLNNEIYEHDLDSWALGEHNCLTIPFDKLLNNGFNTRQTDVRPAKSINTAFQLTAVIFQLQSLQQFGGCSSGHLDWTMVPFVKMSFYKHYKIAIKYMGGYTYEDKQKKKLLEDIDNTMSIEDDLYKAYPDLYRYAFDMTEREVKQAVEGMYHNLNTLQSRSGNQLPFTSINFGTCTLPEGRMISKALLQGCINGVGEHHRTSVFPCVIFQWMKGVNDKPDTPNYDLYRLALKSTAKRLYPNYSNVDWSNNKGYDRNDPATYVSSMGCRTYNGMDINAEPGVNPQTKDGRGNIAPATIIMPTLAMQAKEKNPDNIVEEFMKILDENISLTKDALLERFEYICSQSADSAKFMYENNIMLGYKPEEGIRSALKHGTLAIGQLGLAETLQILIGKNHTTEEGMELAKRIESLFRQRCDEYKEKYKLNFGVYYTPEHNKYCLWGLMW